MGLQLPNNEPDSWWVHNTPYVFGTHEGSHGTASPSNEKLTGEMYATIERGGFDRYVASIKHGSNSIHKTRHCSTY